MSAGFRMGQRVVVDLPADNPHTLPPGEYTGKFEGYGSSYGLSPRCGWVNVESGPAKLYPPFAWGNCLLFCWLADIRPTQRRSPRQVAA